MSNLGDLNHHLFSQLGRLNEDNLKGENLEEEIKKAKAVADISRQIIDTGRLVLEAERFNDDKWSADAEVPKMLSDGSE